jgi:SAM-dependent methyltransferase
MGILKTVLNVGCGPRGRPHGFAGFDQGWTELRHDIDPAVEPDVLGTMTDMSAVATGSVDAVVSSHNIEHMYPHEVPLALAEFVRVLKPDGLLLVTCPDLQSVCARVAQGELASPLYESDAGPIAALDIMYGHRSAMAAGNLFMAHRCGFPRTAGIARPEAFDLWAVASKAALNDDDIRALAVLHLPRRG